MLPLDSSFWWTLRKRTPQGTALEPHRFHGQSTNSESFHQPETNWTKLFPWNFTKHLSLFSPWTFSSFTHSKQRRGKSSLFFFSVHCRSVLVLFQKFGAASTPDLNPPPKTRFQTALAGWCDTWRSCPCLWDMVLVSGVFNLISWGSWPLDSHEQNICM